MIPEDSGGSAFLGFCRSEVNCTTGNDGRNGVFVNHLGHCVSQQNHILIERFNLALKLDAVDKVNRDGYVLPAQSIEKRVLQELTFVVVAHDIFRVEKLIDLQGTTASWQAM